MDIPVSSKPNLDSLKFPVLWHGCLVIRQESGNAVEECLIRQVFEGMGLCPESIKPGGVTRSGGYATWRLSCVIPDIALFRAVTKALKELPGAKMIL